jgi:hypothetical protein
MASIPRYVIQVVDQNGENYEFEKSTKRAWTRYENDVGRCRFFVPYNDLKLTASSVPDSQYSEIRWYRDNILVWQGIAQIIQDTKDGTFVYGETWEAALKWYGVRYDQVHTTTAIGTIVSGEYDQIAAKSNGFFATKVTKGDVENPYNNGTTDNQTITRTLYNENFFTLLQELVAVARGEMHTGWSQYAVFDITLSDVALPDFRFRRDVGTDQNDAVFTLDSEIVDFSIPRDFRSISNSVKGLSIAEGPVVLTSTQTDTTSQTDWYLRESFPFFPTVGNQNELDDKAVNLKNEIKDPYRTISFKFAAGLAPFDGYSMGDNVRIIINRGRTNISELRRVVGMEVYIDDSGIESATPLLQVPRV